MPVVGTSKEVASGSILTPCRSQPRSIPEVSFLPEDRPKARAEVAGSLLPEERYKARLCKANRDSTPKHPLRPRLS